MTYTDLFDAADGYITRERYLEQMPGEMRAARTLMAYCEVRLRASTNGGWMRNYQSTIAATAAPGTRSGHSRDNIHAFIHEVEVEWREEDARMVRQLDQKWLADIRAQGQAEGQLEGALRAKRTWLKEDIARRYGALPPEVAAHIDGIESEDRLDAIKSHLDTATAPEQLIS